MGTTPLFNHIGGTIRKYSRRGLSALSSRRGRAHRLKLEF